MHKTKAYDLGSRSDRVDKAELAAAICQEHKAFIRNVITVQARDLDPDDLYQDLFVSLVAHPPKNTDNIEAYLYRAIVHDCIDERRKRYTYRSRCVEYARRCRSNRVHTTPQDQCVLVEEIENILEFIERALPQHQVKALRLRYCQDRTNAQITEAMGVSDASVRRYISVGLLRAREVMKRSRATSRSGVGPED